MHAYQVLRTLRTSSIAEIVELLTPLLHIDPVAKLPPELTSLIFSYLPPAVLLEASKVSKAWRARTLDSRLWRQKFLSEGWMLDRKEITKFEDSYFSQDVGLKSRSRKAESQEDEPKAKKRATSRENSHVAVDGERPYLDMNQVQPANSSSQHGESRDEEMSGVESQSYTERFTGVASHSLSEPTPSSMFPEPMSTDDGSSSEHSFGTPSSEGRPEFSDPLVLPVSERTVRVNYHHVYKQRRKLEENWIAGRYKSFQLPHRKHPEEAHSECVYTVQYSGKYLVSGSRDRTLRIWDLDTQRLIRRPLSGHNGSVLCLQFDDRPEEDVIISGSSDTDVIVWQFSTGKLIKRITGAHSESVLNLKFDHRYLVTCSKDKMIKVWNRHSMRPGSENYPIVGARGGAKFPSYILDLSRMAGPRDMEQHFTTEQLAPIPEYSLIMRIDSHSAAVNAVHIYRDELVSASGDRDVKVFNLHTGATIALCKGHNKGIACVQYDGRRIVSGSSDDTIRVFDPISQAEVACLQGHTKLVRTVQAAFGDQPGTEEDLAQEARDVDKAFMEAERKRDILANTSRQRVPRDRNAGSRRPQDIMAIGAKLPPGGGGSPWARIISGSYDETVIIWRKAQDGRWVIGHRLKQAEALRAAGGPLVARSERQTLAAQIAAQQTVHNTQGGHHPHPQQVSIATASAAAPVASSSNAVAVGMSAAATPHDAQASHAPQANVPVWSQVNLSCCVFADYILIFTGLFITTPATASTPTSPSYQPVSKSSCRKWTRCKHARACPASDPHATASAECQSFQTPIRCSQDHLLLARSENRRMGLCQRR